MTTPSRPSRGHCTGKPRARNRRRPARPLLDFGSLRPGSLCLGLRSPCVTTFNIAIRPPADNIGVSHRVAEVSSGHYPTRIIMENRLSYVQVTACAEREIQHHLMAAATRPRGSHAADLHLGAAIGAFDLWRCLMTELGAEGFEQSYATDAQRLQALLGSASSS
ncbi:hypothetical protein [Burkholderia multivorans]|uniref:hypothetical protein n=1 Tax=Burkholderia multivorans TaxID=87883 RepID=UPI0020A5C45D|nr:hypothetical protein [Burkholderia multivorans]MDN8010755.1 hypothetical protein [Burkholderia multivorans]